MDATNDFNLEDGFRYIYETYCLALCELTLGELMLQDYNDNVHEKTLRVIIIDSLFSSAAINTYKLLDTSKGTFNIRRLVNKCNSEIKEINGAKLLPLKVKCDEQRFQRLESRRNKSLAHPDFINISGNPVEDYPLYIEDIQMTLDSLAPVIAALSKRIDLSEIGKIKTWSGENKGYSFPLKDQIQTDYKAYKDEHILYEKMYAYLRALKPMDLFRMIYSQEDTTDGQT